MNWIEIPKTAILRKSAKECLENKNKFKKLNQLKFISNEIQNYGITIKNPHILCPILGIPIKALWFLEKSLFLPENPRFHRFSRLLGTLIWQTSLQVTLIKDSERWYNLFLLVGSWVATKGSFFSCFNEVWKTRIRNVIATYITTKLSKETAFGQLLKNHLASGRRLRESLSLTS